MILMQQESTGGALQEQVETARPPPLASTASPAIAAEQSVSGPLLDSSLQIPGFNVDWNQSLLNSTGRAEPSFHALLQESVSYPTIDTSHNQQFLLDHNQQQSQPGLSMMLQGLFEPETKAQQQPIFDHHQRPLSYQNPPLMTMKHHQSSASNLQFANSTAFWNASASAVGYNPSVIPVFEQKPAKLNSDSVQKKSGCSGSSSGSEPALKKPRVEAPSPLPTFKVRKEKLGDRITALQQLVSPFGKTDTASVLHEAIEYIKFLHEQLLSTPYLKNGHPVQHQQSSEKSKDGEGPRQDLRSRGLCLVPIESTYPVASETTADFWTPTFGGTYR
ncbi:transcription factor bHLH112-like isoform X2 [Asparagus officinalis]|uniref:transcription factor bHLH112-like isoform X2 n=1 Tax=Asparagus officinalis TaxID=4686 RepID=UPI00098E674E|nr:transcription factor bHLH112-like isoform X2 [Asparagus officinalis]